MHIKFLKNPYQSILDYILGRWTCPNCHTTWYSPYAPDNCILHTVSKGVIIEERVECPKCHFTNIIWSEQEIVNDKVKQHDR